MAIRASVQPSGTCEPMVLMILSNSDVRSAWNAFHCRQHRKMTIAASGRPLWKPTSPAQAPTHRHQATPCSILLLDTITSAQHVLHIACVQMSSSGPRRWSGGYAAVPRVMAAPDHEPTMRWLF